MTWRMMRCITTRVIIVSHPFLLFVLLLSVSYLRQMMITRLLTCPQVSAGTSQSNLAIVSATVVSAAPSLLVH